MEKGLIIRSNIFRLLFYNNTCNLRFILSIAELLFAIAIFFYNPIASSALSLKVISSVFPPFIWSLIFAISSITNFIIVIQDNYSNKFAMLFSGWNCVLWVYLVTLIAFGGVSVAAYTSEITLALVAIWVFIRTGYTVVGKRITDYG